MSALARVTGAWCVVAAAGACGVDELDVAYLHVRDVAVAPAADAPDDGVVALRIVRGPTSLGFYPVPADVPLLGTGAATVSVEAAVRRSGLSQELRVYPMYAPAEAELVLGPGATDTLRPTFRYRDEVVVALDEGFESPSDALALDLRDASPPIDRVTEGASAGAASGRIRLTAEAPVFEVASGVIVPARAPLLDLWVELDYRGDVPLAVALLPAAVPPLAPGQSPAARYFQGALPREAWTRLYFDIVGGDDRDFLGAGFRVSLLAIHDPSRGETQDVLIDNLRVVYR